MAKKDKKLSEEELTKKKEERELKARKETPWIFVRLVIGIILLAIYFINKYQIDKLYQIFDITRNTFSIIYTISMIVLFIVSIMKCAKIELETKDVSITAKSVRAERQELKFESKLVRFVDFMKGKSWFLLLLSVGILIPNVIGTTLYIISIIIMIALANKHKFKEMDIMLNVSIIGLSSLILRLILV